MEGALDAPRGTVTFDVDARGLDGTVAVLVEVSARRPPTRCATPRAKITPLKAQATLGIEPVSSTDPRGKQQDQARARRHGRRAAHEARRGSSGRCRRADAAGLPARWAGCARPTAAALIGLLGTRSRDHVDKRAGTLSVTMRGASGADAQVDARLNAGGLAASANGTARLFWQADLRAALDLTLQAADCSPLRRGAAARADALLAGRAAGTADRDRRPSSRSTASPALSAARRCAASSSSRWIASASTARSMPMRPTCWRCSRSSPECRGAAARADAPVWPGEPFGESLFGDLAGRVSFTAARAALTPTLIGASAARHAADRRRRNRDRERRGHARGRPRQWTDWRCGASADGLGMRATDRRLSAPTPRRCCRARAGRSSDGPARPAGRVRGQRAQPRIADRIAQRHRERSRSRMRSFPASIRRRSTRRSARSTRRLAIDAPRIRDIVATVLDGGALAVPRLDAAVDDQRRAGAHRPDDRATGRAPTSSIRGERRSRGRHRSTRG